ncbi:MAG: cell filamentation protein Fic [Candidatus Lloydbacteria bacterium RIFCSPLOWO2_01_FULL_50_20]|uniref:Cell filamentation protein Fic n=1 Tax=Candidatus Lloydbacteria bacterium RIFCSPLOWO2_01_FULL_50_20 TaxID=1798665 RepID=A0A1G2DFA4_9BACT|nr:MAG: cell filamentation protein Fic [Candidatus Lloydbacteria bacterium RIFCSPLOWO2_01_FULL_50_20]
MPRKPHTTSQVQLLRERYYKALPGKESLIQIIGEAEVSEQVYNSNAIENSTLTLEETEKILLQIDLDRYVSEREIYEAKNLARVTEYIEKRAKEEELSIPVVLLLHKMLIGNIKEEIAGRFRRGDEWVRVGAHIGADPKDVSGLVAGVLTKYFADRESNIIERISRLHLSFESIHPFCDGNGRIGRVLNNYALLREGYVPVNIAFADRARYYDAFKEYDKNKDTRVMEEIVGRALSNSYHKRLAYLESKKILTLSEYAKKHKQSYSNLLNKANRQTIEAFIEKGVWKIGE